MKLISILTLALLAPAAALADSQSEIRAVYAKIERAMLRSDCNAVVATFAPNYTATDANGNVANRAQAAAGMKEMMKGVRNPKGGFFIKRIDVEGDEATVWVGMVVDVEMKGPKGWTKAHFDMKFIETARKINGVWKFTSTFEVANW